MLSLMDRIEIAKTVVRGNMEYKREMREGRAAGSNCKNEPKNGSDNRAEQKSNEEENTDAKPNKQNPSKPKPITEIVSQSIIRKRAEERLARKKEQEAKSSEESVKTSNEAAMNHPNASPMNKPGVINFGAFGFNIDTEAIDNSAKYRAQATQQPIQQNPNLVNQQAVQQGQTLTPQQVWAMQQQAAAQQAVQQGQTLTPQQVWAMQQQAAAAQQTAQQFEQAHAQQVGHGNHRVDEPKKPAKQKPQKAKPDDVVDIPDIKIESTTEVKKRPDIIDSPLPKAEPIEQEVAKPIFDNREMISKYPYLKDIEEIALKNNYQVQFTMNCNLIDVIIFTTSIQTPAVDKCFTIDPGNIIDRRVKVFPCISPVYEGLQAYPLFIPNPAESGAKKGPNILNVKLINGLIVGGNQWPNERDGLYTKEYRDLNKYVALITIPTKEMNKEQRNAMQNRLMELYKKNFLQSICSANPGIRFRITEYDKKTGEFTLDSSGVPCNYGHPIASTKQVKMRVLKKSVQGLIGTNN